MDPVWTFEAGARLSRRPAVVDGTAYLAADDGTLHAVAGGRELWRAQVKAPATAVSVTADTVVTSGFEVGHAFDRHTGVARWQVDGLVSPYVVGGLVVSVNFDDLSAYDLATGAHRWTCVRGGLLDARPAFADGVIAVTGGFEGNHFHGCLWAVDAATGEVRWGFENELPDESTVAPFHATAAGPVFWVSRLPEDDFDMILTAYDARTGAELTAVKTTNFTLSGLTVGGPVVYFAGDESVVAVDVARRQTLFSAPVEIVGWPLLGDGVLIVAGKDGVIRGLDPAGGGQLWAHTVPNADWPALEGEEYTETEPPIALVDGVVYVVAGDTLTALA